MDALVAILSGMNHGLGMAALATGCSRTWLENNLVMVSAWMPGSYAVEKERDYGHYALTDDFIMAAVVIGCSR